MIGGMERSAILIEWFDLARWPDWSTSKLPFLGAAALLLAPAEASGGQMLAIIGTILCWAAFGYAINDVADMACDRLAGKSNRAADVSPLLRTLFLGLTASTALALSVVWSVNWTGPAFVVIALLLAGAYSLPPVRLKERGAIGLVAGAAAQWVLPVLAIANIESGGWKRPAAWSLALLGLAIGIRWMAIHQLHDTMADHQAGVRTYASTGGQVWPVLLGAFLSEVVLLTVALVVTWPVSAPAWAALAFWIVQQAFRPRGESMREKLQGYDHAPLAEFYFFLLPVALAFARGLSSPEFMVLAGLFVAVGWGYLAMMMGEWHDAWAARALRR